MWQKRMSDLTPPERRVVVLIIILVVLVAGLLVIGTMFLMNTRVPGFEMDKERLSRVPITQLLDDADKIADCVNANATIGWTVQ